MPKRRRFKLRCRAKKNLYACQYANRGTKKMAVRADRLHGEGQIAPRDWRRAHFLQFLPAEDSGKEPGAEGMRSLRQAETRTHGWIPGRTLVAQPRNTPACGNSTCER